jgi:nucleoside phosphorylase
MPRAIILTAILVEYKAVRVHLTDLREETHPQGTVYERGKFVANTTSWEVGIVDVGPGNANAGVEAERAIAYFNPSVILFVGVAGGIKDVAIGDVVAATKVYGYESGKAKQKFQPRPDLGQSTYSLIQRSRAESKKSDWLQRLTSAPESTPRVFVEPIAAGEKVIASSKSNVFKFIQLNYGDAVAVEMEGRGLLQAAHANHQVSALVIRGISDLIDGKTEADAGGSQEIAAQNASAFAFEILAKLVLDNDEPKSMVEQEIQKSLITEDLSDKNRAEVVSTVEELEEELGEEEQAFYEIESELKSRPEPNIRCQLKEAYDWLWTNKRTLAKRAGKDALNNFPEESENSIRQFSNEIEIYLDRICRALKRTTNQTKSLRILNEHSLPNSSIYVEALNAVKNKIPGYIDQVEKKELEDLIKDLQDQIIAFL